MACSSSPSRPLHLNYSAPFPSLSPDMDKNRAKPPLHPLLVPLWTRPSRPLQTRHDALVLLLCLLQTPMPPPLHSPIGPRGAPVHRPLSPLPPIKGAPEHAFETTPPTSPPQTSSFRLPLTQSSPPEQAELPEHHPFPTNLALPRPVASPGRLRRSSAAVLHPHRHSPVTAGEHPIAVPLPAPSHSLVRIGTRKTRLVHQIPI
jgi:hypothetical protein